MRSRGFVLVAALWMLAALAALASAYATFALDTAASAYLPQDRLVAEAALRAAVELTAWRQLAWPKAARPSHGAFSTRLGDARLDVAYLSENARIDLNAAPHDVLAGLFTAVGASTDAAGFLADRVIAWRGKLDDRARADEAGLYRKAGLSYAPTGTPFDNALELALLPGAAPDLLRRALPYLTVYGGASRVDPLVADPVVLSALPGMTKGAMTALRAAAAGPRPDNDALARLAGTAKDFVALDPNDSVRAQIVLTLPRRRVAAEIVLQVKEGAPEPYQILYWRDDFDGAGF